MTAKTAPSLEEIQAAQRRIAGIARVTPVYSSETFSRLTGRPVHLKAENLQRTGAFKVRGAVNKIALLTPEEHAAGVVTASAGNHGQAVAWAAREAGALARIFMPHHTPMAKIEAHRAHLEDGGLLEERRRKNLAGEVFAVASGRAKTHLEHAVEGDPELRRVLDAVQSRSLDPLTAVREILQKVFHVDGENGT